MDASPTQQRDGEKQEDDSEEYVIRLRGTLREASAMGEYVTLTRTIETRLGRKGFTLQDVIENRGFESQPLMMIYHINLGFPLLSPNTRMVAPIERTVAFDEQSASDRGVERCCEFSAPQAGYREKAFFHTLASSSKGDCCVSLLNRDVGNGIPLGFVLRFNSRELPYFTQWKVMDRGFYVVGFEPGTITQEGRGILRERGELPFLGAQESYTISLQFDVLDTLVEFDAIEKEIRDLLS